MMNGDLISIIVPIYKVENYITKSINSIIQQTYWNLEIILVDDGSPDNCGRICDEFAKKDSRIKVIHKDNGGLSSARNKGLDICKGEYVAFIDSDDWIDKDMIEKLYKRIVDDESDIAICSYVFEIAGMSEERKCNIKNCTLSREKALQELILDEKINNYAWNKLYKRELFKNIRFPEGRYFEDIFIMYRIFDLCERISVLDSPSYHYLQRAESIMGSISFFKELDALEAHKQRYIEMDVKYPQFHFLMMIRYKLAYLATLSLLSDNRNLKYEDFPELEEYRRFYFLKCGCKKIGYGLKEGHKIMMFICFFSPRFTIQIYRFVHLYRLHCKKLSRKMDNN